MKTYFFFYFFFKDIFQNLVVIVLRWLSVSSDRSLDVISDGWFSKTLFEEEKGKNSNWLESYLQI